MQWSVSRFRIFLVALLFVIAVAPAVSSQSVHTSWEESVMAVLAVDPGADKFVKRATAFHIGGGVFYTNAHVVRGPLPSNYSQMFLASTTATRTRDSWVGPVQVSCVDARWQGAKEVERAFPFDVAKVHVPLASQLPALPISNQLPDSGMRVRIVGFAGASRGWPPKLYVAIGRIGQVDHSAQTFMIDVESGFALEGSSGSPVITDASEVIGIIYARQGVRDGSAAQRMAAITTYAMQSGCP